MNKINKRGRNDELGAFGDKLAKLCLGLPNCVVCTVRVFLERGNPQGCFPMTEVI